MCVREREREIFIDRNLFFFCYHSFVLFSFEGEDDNVFKSREVAHMYITDVYECKFNQTARYYIVHIVTEDCKKAGEKIDENDEDA